MGDADEAQPVEQNLLVPCVQSHFGSLTFGLFGHDPRQVWRDLGGSRSAAGKVNCHVGISGRADEGQARRCSLFPGGLSLPAPVSTSPLPDPSVRRRFPRTGALEGRGPEGE
ncbi:hypothetical protein GCM10007291_47640 [Gemmobacter nanjingensis]|uniref:Uncharacterized protein n=1 Tax=Gemmobacter nanjingensis TaxID=488454 RepID=A0ABQ3FUH1_9RHOB|nr:hypothetical protein GCM10007291_47640 [Gemmobacter nanjingensis]